MYNAYEDVRNDNSPTNWAVFKYEGKQIVLAATGEPYDEFLTHFTGALARFEHIKSKPKER